MGIAKPVLDLILSQHSVYEFEGPMVTVGVQDIWYNRRDFIDYMARFDGPKSPEALEGLAASPQDERIPAGEVFAAMGIDGYQTLDMFGDEGATILHDLCQPIPDDLNDRFSLVIDGGSLEHIFDTRQAFTNLISMCRVGGVVVHISPLAGWDNHGFYSFNPKLLFNTYGLNGFGDIRCFLVHLPRKLELEKGWVEVCPSINGPLILDGKEEMVLLLFFARKERAVTPFQMPIDTHQTNDDPEAKDRIENRAEETDLPEHLRPPKGTRPSLWYPVGQ